MARRFVLIGAGQASASAARTLRQLGFDGEVVIVGDEPHGPYQRPPLSKEYLAGQASADELWAVAPDWFAESGVELRLGRRAVRVDTKTRAVELDDGTTLAADAVLIATGGRPRRLPGVEESPSVRYLRTIEDADRLRADIRPGGRVAIVGAGFIGSEVAATARSLGAKVTLIETLAAPLQRVLGDEIGAVCGEIHREHGVDLRLDVSVTGVEGGGSAARVTLSDGSVVEADVVVIGIGIQPNDEIARASEITVGNGIRVDELCRTSAEGIFAAGDVANHYHPVFRSRMRVEHFDSATRLGAVAARNMLGTRTEIEDPHWFWSDQYDHSFQYAGHAERWDEVVVRGSLDERDFVAFYLKDGKVRAAFGIDRGGEVMLAKTLIAKGIAVEPEKLRDEDVDLEEIVLGPAEDLAPVSDGPPLDDESRYVRAARSGQVREGTVRRFEVAGTPLAIARSKGKAYALHNLCTHLACHLSSGAVEGDGLVCLCHGSIFELATGTPINPPATRPVKTYPVMEKDGQIFVAVE